MSIFSEDIVSYTRLTDIVDCRLIWWGDIEAREKEYDRQKERNSWGNSFIEKMPHADPYACDALILDFNKYDLEPIRIEYNELFNTKTNLIKYSIEDLFEEIININIDGFLVPPHVSESDFFRYCFSEIQKQLFSKISSENRVGIGQRTNYAINLFNQTCRGYIEMKWSKWKENILISPTNPKAECVTPTWDYRIDNNPFVAWVNPGPGFIVEPVSLGLDFTLSLKH